MKDKTAVATAAAENSVPVGKVKGRSKPVRQSQITVDAGNFFLKVSAKTSSVTVSRSPRFDETGEMIRGPKFFVGSEKGAVPNHRHEVGAQVDISNAKNRKSWRKALPRASPAICRALKKEATTTAAAEAESEERWFRIELSLVALEAGAWGEYPHGWCGKLVGQPKDCVDCLYLQLTHPYWIFDPKRGRVTFKTDHRNPRFGKNDQLDYKTVPCGMWVPRDLLVPIDSEEATSIYQQVEGYFRGLTEAVGGAKTAEEIYEILKDGVTHTASN